MANSVDPDQTAENDSADIDQTAENGKYCRPWSNCWERQTVQTLISLLRMANTVDFDQIAENVEQCRPWSD